MPDCKNIAIIGGGLSGITAAHWCKHQSPDLTVRLFERQSRLLPWMHRSGLGPVCLGLLEEGPWREGNYPRGLPWIRAALDRWTGASTRDWLESLKLPVELGPDGRLQTSEPQAFAAAMTKTLEESGIEITRGFALESLSTKSGGSHRIWSRDGQQFSCDRLLLATGGERNHGMALARELNATENPCLPAFIRLKLASPMLAHQFGHIERTVRLRYPNSGLSATGPVVLSARGLEGDALSALSGSLCEEWKQRGYRFSLEVDWVPSLSTSIVRSELESHCQVGRRKGIGKDPLFSFTPKQWLGLLERGRIDPQTPWIRIRSKQLQTLVHRIKNHSIAFSGMGLPGGERAWAGGIQPEEIDWSSGAFRSANGVFFAGEILDALGTPGGAHLNLLFAGAYLAGSAMALQE